MIPHNDPEYASKLTAMAEAMVTAEEKLVDILQKYKLEEKLADLNLDLKF
jgi:flagellum-specific peptidoglycan hydrolase FlgJ